MEIHGVGVFHPSTGEVRSDGADGVACWFIDTDYNDESFFVQQAWFLSANDPYKALRATLKAESRHRLLCSVVVLTLYLSDPGPLQAFDRAFREVHQMNRHLLAEWRRRVRPDDTVIICPGDVARADAWWNRRLVLAIQACPGRQALVLGNHHSDLQALRQAGFATTQCSLALCATEPPALSYYPLRRIPVGAINAHGYLDEGVEPTRRHLNLAVEHLDYSPVGLVWSSTRHYTPAQIPARRYVEEGMTQPKDRTMGNLSEWDGGALECDQCAARGRPARECPRCDGEGYLWGNTPLAQMAERAKRWKHHTVPQWYQKNFANGNGQVHYWKKGDQRVQQKHPAAVFYQRDAYNATDNNGDLIAESESVYAVLDGKAKTAVDETVHAYVTASRRGCREIQVPRGELEVLVNGLLVRNARFHEEAVERYGRTKDDEGRRLESRLARVAVVKHAAELAQTRLPKLMAAKLTIAGLDAEEELIYGDGAIAGVTDGGVQLRALPLTPTISAIWAWAEGSAEDHTNGTQAAVRPLQRRLLREFNIGLARKSEAIAGRSSILIERFRKAHERRTKQVRTRRSMA